MTSKAGGVISVVEYMHDAQGLVSNNINHATKYTKDDKKKTFITKVAVIKIGISRG